MVMANLPNHRPPCERLHRRLLMGHVFFGLAVAAYLTVVMARLALLLV
jgi:hypothetical protein